MGSNIGPHQIDVMFEHVLLEKCPSITELRKIGENFCIRPLQSDDFEHGFFDVLRQGLLYRWTEHSADFFLNDHWGREKGPQNYTPVVYFLDHDLL